MPVLLAIPARFASTRYPGKPLVMLRGADGTERSLIERAWRAACEVKGIDRVVIATDDDRIASAGQAFGAEVVMTSSTCRNGTERCADALARLGTDYDIVVNLQGDAPLTPPWFVEPLVTALHESPNAAMATPVLRCTGAMRDALLADRRAGRVGGTTAVFSETHHALYFSKEVIPYSNVTYDTDAPTPVYHHVGVYAYRADALLRYPEWPEGTLEKLEGLEQLRFLEQNRPMRCVEVSARGRDFWELNNPEDVARIEQMLNAMGMS